MVTINDLPNEIFFGMFSYLTIVERQRLQTVCKRWQMIIQQMWRTIYKLKFHEGDRHRGKYIHGTLQLVSRNASHLTDVLKLFNGNLKKLDISHRSSINKMPVNFFKILEENKNLSTLRLVSRDRNIGEAYLKCLIPKNIQNLSIDIVFATNLETASLEKILLEAQSLEFLEIHYHTPPRIGIINELDSLKSLHIDAGNDKLETALNLPNLEVLSVLYAGISDSWIIQLVRNCRKLRSLELRECHSFTGRGLSVIAKLPNLRYLNLLSGPLVDNKLLNELSNLEEIYFDLDSKISLDEMISFLKRSPNLTKYGFSYLGHDMLFESAGRILGVNIEVGKHRYLEDYEWDIRF